MSLLLPPVDHTAREFFEVADLAARRWVSFREAKTAAANTFANVEGVSRVFSLSLRANGDVQLLSIGPKSGVVVLWNFGNPVGGQ